MLTSNLTKINPVDLFPTIFRREKVFLTLVKIYTFLVISRNKNFYGSGAPEPPRGPGPSAIADLASPPLGLNEVIFIGEMSKKIV